VDELTRTKPFDERCEARFGGKDVLFGFGQSSRYVTSPLSDKLISVLIAIAGGTGSGKSTLADALAAATGGVVIRIDDYYRPLNHLTFEERELVNFDAPDAIDHVLMTEQLWMLLDGQTIEKPVYDFTKHTRAVFGEEVSPCSIIIVEGLFALYWAELNQLCGTKVFVETPYELRFMRRLRRDIDERGRDEDEVTTRFRSHVNPMHERFVQPTCSNADVVVHGDRPLQESLVKVLDLVGSGQARLL
jgi:uridine kinase